MLPWVRRHPTSRAVCPADVVLLFPAGLRAFGYLRCGVNNQKQDVPALGRRLADVPRSAVKKPGLPVNVAVAILLQCKQLLQALELILFNLVINQIRKLQRIQPLAWVSGSILTESDSFFFE